MTSPLEVGLSKVLAEREPRIEIDEETLVTFLHAHNQHLGRAECS